MITPETRAEIRRLYYAEHWKVGTIASTLSVHADTVRRAIESERFNLKGGRPRPRQIDPYVPFMKATLERYPRLCATRLHDMLKERGYPGGIAQVRRTVRHLRPARKREAYLRLSVLKGEQAQVDWGSFGKVSIGKGQRLLSCFVMVLSWSRAVHAVFTLDQTLESFMRGHVEAFGYFGAVPREILYDNLKSAVLERRGDAIRFQPRLLELAGHYHFAPRPVTPARGNEKGRVERHIQYLRTSFFAARRFRDVDDLNAQFRQWRNDKAHARLVPGEVELTVADALEQEREAMLSLPEHALSCELLRPTRSGKTPYVRFDRNLYSIPHELVRQPVTLAVTHETLRVLDGAREVARHRRSYDTKAVVEDPAHIVGLLEHKRAARLSKGRDRLRDAVPETDAMFEELALRGENLGTNTARLLRLLDEYGVEEVRDAVRCAVAKEAFGAGSVAHILEQRRRARGQAPPIAVTLPDRPGVKELRLSPHRLEQYDDLAKDDDISAP
ncbi:MAG: IS21 family transposase [Bacteroidota bacterium]